MNKMVWLFVGMTCCSRIWGATLYVDLNSSAPVAPFDGWATAASTIQDAVDASAPGDVIRIADGHYLISAEIKVTKVITLQSVNGPESTVVDGQGIVRCFNLGNYACVIGGLTITNGDATGIASANCGGGIYCTDTTPVLTNCTISGNSAAQYGGGLYYGTANNCRITENFASYGGGMYYSTANSCSIIDNSANYGGGLYYGSADQCTISGNDAVVDGGGMYEGTASSCVVSGNTSMYGGGLIYVTANNCMITGNTASSTGGGMEYGVANNCVVSGNSAANGGGIGGNGAKARNCIISGNRASVSGGGANGAVLYNCTISGNSAKYGAGTNWGYAYNCIIYLNVAEDGKNLKGTSARYCCSPDLGHGVNGNITNSPMLVSWSYIATNSPCRGAGAANYASGLDMDGEVWLDPPSMGCDEYHGVVTGALGVDFDSDKTRIVDTAFISFSEQTTGAVYRLVWDFADGTLVTNSPEVRHTWSYPGRYDVVLTAYNDTFPEGVMTTHAVEVFSAEESAMRVSLDGADTNDGLSWATAKLSIQAAVDAQQVDGGGIWISNGTYVVTNTIVVDKAVRISGVNGANKTIIDGQGMVRCFDLGNSSCVLEDLTISNGYASGEYPLNCGGGVFCKDATTPILANCIIRGNVATYQGGGIYYGTLTNCTVCENSADLGGGVRSSLVNNCRISGNSATQGGGFYAGTANNCMVIDNVAEYGGGVSLGTANNCLISGNSAGRGGALQSAKANSCTIVGNSAVQNGGGAYSSTLKNCIIWYNESPIGNDLYNGTAQNSCSPDVTHGLDGNFTNAPGFIDYENGDYHLMSSSPCINVGTNDPLSGAVDLDDNPRIVDGIVDVGAYEYQGSGFDDQDGDGLPDDWEQGYFSALDVTPEGNADGDDYNNMEEFIAGTDPTDADSFFTVTNTFSGSGFVVDWNAISSRWYKVLWQPGLTNDPEVLQDYLEYPQNSYTDTVHNASAAGFYQG